MSKSKTEQSPVRFNQNLAYLLEQHDMFLNDPNSVSDEMKTLFGELSSTQSDANNGDQGGINGLHVKNLIRLVDHIRTYGHLYADIYPVHEPNREDLPSISYESHDLDETILKSLPSSLVSDHFKDKENAYEAIEHLKDLYQGPIAYEYTHINNDMERQWLKETIEQHDKVEMNNDERISLFNHLAKVQGFEKYIHKNFVGAKRFSIEGVDSLVPLLKKLQQLMAVDQISNLQIGMAHRGRLNVLTHVLNKSYEMMLAEFMHENPIDYNENPEKLSVTQGWTGDVKYHLGATTKTNEFDIDQTIELANNPSHLEIAAPVVLGKTRATQTSDETNGQVDYNKSIAAIIHGDAAFSGQGIVAETLNLSQLPGYCVGGTIHIITNNLIGFTTEPDDGRSGLYSSDIAKGYDVPIIHVNADKVEHVLRAVEVAYLYRQKFNKDVVIDLIGYRRYGHNEMDEPMATNPLLYKDVKSHDPIDELYGSILVEDGVISEEDKSTTIESAFNAMKSAHQKINKSDQNKDASLRTPEHINSGYKQIDTGVDLETLKQIQNDLMNYPDDFKVFSKLKKILQRRNDPFEKETGKVDWAHAEALAFASILQDGYPVRLTGQDSERGTFAHRHAVLHDEESGREFTPLQHITNAKAPFIIHNSPLSEAAVVAFEYGYNVQKKNALTIWEAQFGDFGNMAQMIYDNFISASNAKWGEQSGFAMFLPHGYEGQGPEHSSSRIERFLQSAAENNWTVANLTSTANYFHLLRRQAHHLDTDVMRPLVLASPKSLLRNQTVADTIDQFTTGHFKTVIIPSYKKTKVKKLVIGSGKVIIDIKEAQKEENDELLIVSLEQIYPFPTEKLESLIKDLPKLEEIAFVQEEPRNMGFYSFVRPLLSEMLPSKIKELTYIGRPRRASTSEGDPEMHKHNQQDIINLALKL